MQNLIELVRIFLEKRFIRSIISLVITILIFTSAPSTSIIPQRIGYFWTAILVFCSVLLLLELLIWGYDTLVILVKTKKCQMRTTQENHQNFEHDVRRLWKIVDGFSFQDKEY